MKRFGYNGNSKNVFYLDSVLDSVVTNM